MNKIGSLLGKKIEAMLPMRSHFGTVMANDGGMKIEFFLFYFSEYGFKKTFNGMGTVSN